MVTRCMSLATVFLLIHCIVAQSTVDVINRSNRLSEVTMQAVQRLARSIDALYMVAQQDLYGIEGERQAIEQESDFTKHLTGSIIERSMLLNSKLHALEQANSFKRVVRKIEELSRDLQRIERNIVQSAGRQAEKQMRIGKKAVGK